MSPGPVLPCFAHNCLLSALIVLPVATSTTFYQLASCSECIQLGKFHLLHHCRTARRRIALFYKNTKWRRYGYIMPSHIVPSKCRRTKWRRYVYIMPSHNVKALCRRNAVVALWRHYTILPSRNVKALCRRNAVVAFWRHCTIMPSHNVKALCRRNAVTAFRRHNNAHWLCLQLIRSAATK